MEVKQMHFALLFLTFVICTTQAQLTDTSDCSHVKAYYDAKDVESSMAMQASGMENSSICIDVGDYTCCNPQVEARLLAESVKDINKTLVNGTKEMAMLLKQHGEKLHSFVLRLINGTKKSLHTLFSDTYDSTYTDHQDVFMQFFDDLKTYYEGGVIDLTDIFDSLFSSLTKIAFKLYQYEINDDYAQCIGVNMHIIQPFADKPKKLENEVERAFIAVRTYLEALATGRAIIESLTKMFPTSNSAMEYMSVTHCAKCAGYVTESPCENICESTMHDILCSLHGDFSDTWTDYIHAMNSLLLRMKGPFNIDAAISPINVKISACIMLLQDNVEPIESAVERACGPLVKANVSVNPFIGGFDLSGLSRLGPDLSHSLDHAELRERTKRSTKKGRRTAKRKNMKPAHSTRDVTSSKRGDISGRMIPVQSRLDLQDFISESRDIQKILKSYWRNAPKDICTNILQATSDNCWNGKAVVVADTSSPANSKRCPAGVKADPKFRHGIHNLKKVTSKLQEAFVGIDPSNPDKEVYRPEEISSGDGSGDEESEETDSETRTTSSTKATHRHVLKTVATTTTPAVDKSQSVMSLEDWEVEILEDVLGRPVARKELLKNVKDLVLQRHPHLKHKRQGKNRIKVAELTENQINRLKKMLGIQHETSSTTTTESNKDRERVEESGVEDRQPAVTARNKVETTSAAFGLKSSPLLLLVAVIFIHHQL